MLEPNWNDSVTLPTELWKNRLIPLHDRLEIADGAIADRDAVIVNLRTQLQALRELLTVKPCDICGDGRTRLCMDYDGIVYRECGTCTSDFAGVDEMRFNQHLKR